MYYLMKKSGWLSFGKVQDSYKMLELWRVVSYHRVSLDKLKNSIIISQKNL